FSVNEEKRIYHCFGCSATGNVISFLMNKEGMGFPEAVMSLAARFGVVIPRETGARPDGREGLYAALKLAADYFYGKLRASAGGAAREYFKGRGFGEDEANEFKVGFAPDSWDGLGRSLKAKGISAEAMLAAGLVVKKDSGGTYDRFRGRLIFPIIDTRGRTIGFGGRIMGKGEPKYLNSPESPVFRKGETLYGLYQAKQAVMREKAVIVVEGYFDLLALHKNGFTNSVATMGTALTKDHLRLLKGYAETVYVLFDADEAGRKAAVRGLPLFLEEEVDCRAVLLPEGKDPDEFLSRRGPESMREVLFSAPALMEFYLRELKGGLDLKRAPGKRKYLNGAVEYLSRVRNVAERGHYVSIAAADLGIAPDAVYEALKLPAGKAGTVLEKRVRTRGTNISELTILRVLASHPELYVPAVEPAVDGFADAVLKEAGRAIVSRIKAGGAIDDSVIEEVEDEAVRSALARLMLGGDEGFIESPGRMLEDCLKRVLNKGKIKETTRAMIKRLAEVGLSEAASEMEKRIEGAKRGSRGTRGPKE
ncbi:MAG: DNA primase, partial [Thermodesulfobacteriota bacterium]